MAGIVVLKVLLTYLIIGIFFSLFFTSLTGFTMNHPEYRSIMSKKSADFIYGDQMALPIAAFIYLVFWPFVILVVIKSLLSKKKGGNNCDSEQEGES